MGAAQRGPPICCALWNVDLYLRSSPDPHEIGQNNRKVDAQAFGLPSVCGVYTALARR